MGILRSILIRFGLADFRADRSPINVFLLDDDHRRHRWFKKRFVGDEIDIAEDVENAKKFLSENVYDAVFLDHDLLPEHYESSERDDQRTGYAIAHWLTENIEIQKSATFIVHTRNADGAVRMVEKLRESNRTVEYVPFPMLEQRIKSYWKR
jgi:hypothetical protein